MVKTPRRLVVDEFNDVYRTSPDDAIHTKFTTEFGGAGSGVVSFARATAEHDSASRVAPPSDDVEPDNVPPLKNPPHGEI